MRNEFWGFTFGKQNVKNFINDAFANNKYGLATAESFVFFVIILVITSVQMYFSRKKEEELM